MGRILICEPDPEVRDLLQRVVARLGHEPVLDGRDWDDVEAIILEPAHLECVGIAQAVRAVREDVSVVCASIEPPTPGSRRLEPIRHLLKPFGLLELEEAVEKALARRLVKTLQA